MDPARGDLALNLPSQILAFVSQSQQTVEIPLCHHQVDGFAGALSRRMSLGGLGFGALHGGSAVKSACRAWQADQCLHIVGSYLRSVTSTSSGGCSGRESSNSSINRATLS
jgi:hypothetical protein